MHSTRDLILSYVESMKIVVVLIVNISDDFDKFQLSYWVPHTTVTVDRQLDRNHEDLTILSEVSMLHMPSLVEKTVPKVKSNDKWRRCSPLCFMHLIRLEYTCQLNHFKPSSLQAILQAWHVLPYVFPAPLLRVSLKSHNVRPLSSLLGVSLFSLSSCFGS
jgi:hypothetical protein